MTVIEAGNRFSASALRCRTVHVPLDLLTKMAPEAKKRGITPATLAYLIVDAVVEGKLINAVLDDGAE